MTTPLATFIHVTDTHISHTPDVMRDGIEHLPLYGGRSFVAAVAALPFTPDFILHTGDVAFDPIEEAYGVAREVFADLPCPILYLPGNHDSAEMLQRLLVDRPPVMPYDHTHVIKGIRLICLDSSLKTNDGPAGRLEESQLDWLDAQIDADDLPLVVAVHHNVVTTGIVPWLDDYMRLTNGEALHARLLRVRDRVRIVLGGHVHQATQIMRDGILYVSGLSTWYAITGMPGQTTLTIDRTLGVGFNVITVSADQVFVREHRFIVEANVTD